MLRCGEPQHNKKWSHLRHLILPWQCLKAMDTSLGDGLSLRGSWFISQVQTCLADSFELDFYLFLSNSLFGSAFTRHSRIHTKRGTYTPRFLCPCSSSCPLDEIPCSEILLSDGETSNFTNPHSSLSWWEQEKGNGYSPNPFQDFCKGRSKHCRFH